MFVNDRTLLTEVFPLKAVKRFFVYVWQKAILASNGLRRRNGSENSLRFSFNFYGIVVGGGCRVALARSLASSPVECVLRFGAAPVELHFLCATGNAC